LVKQDKAGALYGYPLTPSILPIQIITIGQLALLAIPAEITCTAGKRLENTLTEILKPKGVKAVVIAPYSNEYSGYITTPEEFNTQCYEGGHTLFGEQTLTAYINETTMLAKELCKEKKMRNVSSVLPIEFPEEVLNKRLYSYK